MLITCNNVKKSNKRTRQINNKKQLKTGKYWTEAKK